MKLRLKYFWLFILPIIGFSQQVICINSVNDYSVDSNENNGNGSTNSIYEWKVVESNFVGRIVYNTNSHNSATIYWVNSPPGNYTLEVTETNGACKSSSQLEVKIVNSPSFILEDVALCSEESEVTLSAPSGFTTYKWTDSLNNILGTNETVNVNKVGTYYVEVSLGTCTFKTSVNVSLEQEPWVEMFITKRKIVANVHSTNTPFMFQLEKLDGTIVRPYQSSNVFDDVDYNVYIVRVKSPFNCIYSQEVLAVFVPTAFTPNGDGINDILYVQGFDEFFPNAKVMVYDRYGKLLKVLDKSNGFKWDGYYLNDPVPSDTYWFSIEYGNGKVRNGYVVIKQRN